MRHRKKKKFGKGNDHRRKLLKSLASSLILYEKIQTSYANARAAKAYTEKLITKAKEGSLHNRRQLLAKLSSMAAKKAIEVLGPKYNSRKGGYTRLIKLNSAGGGQSKTILELVE
ncbi:MAG: 50S ribosomal protein L17 [Candidatus Doudnabacteria bacterium]|nr:50S ribosomal protein L17 [Candidatus Doudnabacteria bacterium]